MPSSYTSSARFTLQATGENNNTWGVILNQGVFQLVDDSVNGRIGFALSGSHALTVNNGSTDEARMAFLDVTSGSGGFIQAPAVPKGYFIRNGSAGVVHLLAGGGTEAQLQPGDAGPVFTDGSTVYPVQVKGKTIQAYVDAGDLAQKNYTDAQIAGAVINMPSVTGQAGKLLTNDGTVAYWSGILQGGLTVNGGGLLVNGDTTVGGTTTLNGPVNAQQTVALSGVLTPAPITVAGQVNDYNPPGLANASTLRINATVAGVILTGIAGGYPGRVLVLECVGLAIQLWGGSTASGGYNPTPANQFASLGGSWSWGLRGGQSVVLVYDGVVNMWRALIDGGMEMLVAGRTYYVNPVTGDDSGSSGGLTPATAFKTVQYAFNTALLKSFANQQIIIQCAAGTYTGQINIYPCVGLSSPGQLVIQGDMVTPANVVFANSAGGNATINGAFPGSMCQVQGITFTGTVNVTYHVYAQLGAFINVGASNVFGASYSNIVASQGGIVQLVGNITFAGASYTPIWSTSGGRINITGRTINVTGTPAWGAAFVFAEQSASVLATGTTFTGAATGGRYNVQTNGVINTNAGGANYFPGSVAGIATTGGQYV